MTTDNKTLADVQPGGRVRLWDQALSTSEGARRYVADYFATQLRRHDFRDYILTELAADFACALAQHLSAQPSPATCKEGLQVQPSPAGQGDTRIPFETWAKAGGFDVSKFKGIYNSLETRAAWGAWLYWQRRSAQPSPGGQDALDCIGRIEEAIEFRVPHDIYAAVHGDLAELKAALAARQPDTAHAAYHTGKAIGRREAELEAAARQPVGEPVAVRVTPEMRAAFRKAYREGGFWHDRLDTALDAMMRAAPPAQAVDLERFRGTVKSQYSMTEWMHRCGFVSAKKLEESKKNHDHLMALIDSQAVGNGQPELPA